MVKEVEGKLNFEEIASYLSGLGYPVFVHGVIAHAAEQGAPDRVLYFLEKLPHREFRSETELEKEIRKLI